MANRIKGITVEIGGDTTGLDKALKSVNSSITKTQSALNDVNRLLKLDPSNTVLVAQKQELLAQAISQTEEKLSALEAAQEQVTAAFARGDIGADKYQAFQREIEETRGKLNKYKAVPRILHGWKNCLLLRERKSMTMRMSLAVG